MAGFSQYQVELSRDSYTTPWGFRLQGGKDLGQPLSVQRVFTGSPAEGELQRGDLIVVINDRNAGELLHKQAQDLIKFGGGSISLLIKRPAPGRGQVSKTVTVIRPNQPHAPTFRSLPIQQAKPISRSPVRSPIKSVHAPSQAQMPRHYGGGGPDFGADYTHVVPRAPNYGGGGPEYGADYHRPTTTGTMLERVQFSLDNAVSNYDPEGVITTPQYIPQRPEARAFLYEPAAQYGGSQNAVYSPPSTFAPAPPTPAYVPQFQAQQQQHPQQYAQDEEDYEIPSVSERKKAFSHSEPRRVRARPAQRPATRPVYRPSNEVPDFGTDYRMPGAAKQQQQQPVYRPFSSPQPAQQSFQHSPQPRGGGGAADQSGVVGTSLAPSWRGTLKSSGPRPWNAEELGELPPQQAAPPKASPAQRSQRPAQKPYVPPQQHNTAPQYGQIGGQEGPQVVHLQYNSPIGMYSAANVKETLTGQTIGLNKPSPNPNQPGNPDGPRDWSQSAVLRMIQSDEKGQGGGGGGGGGGPAPPRPPPKPTASAGYNRPQIDDEVGISDF